MRAAVFDEYGPAGNVRIEEMPTPRAGAGEVLVRVRSVAVTAADSRVRGARFPRGFGFFARLAFGIRRPRRRILGSAYSGAVEEVGDGVTRFRPGDEVCGMTGAKFGAHAEFVVVPAEKAVAKPADVSHDDAAGVLFGGTTAQYFLHHLGALADGMTVLVNGASGAVGTNAVQLARIAGAEVTAVASAGNAALLTELGAQHTIDYAATDVATLATRYDRVIDTVGVLDGRTGRRLLRPGGVLMLASADLPQTIAAIGRAKMGSTPERLDDIEHLLQLVDSGRLRVVIDGVYDLADAARAHARVDTGHKVGNVLLHP